MEIIVDGQTYVPKVETPDTATTAAEGAEPPADSAATVTKSDAGDAAPVPVARAEQPTPSSEPAGAEGSPPVQPSVSAGPPAGQNPAPLTVDGIQQMSHQEINDNWDSVSKVLAGQRGG